MYANSFGRGEIFGSQRERKRQPSTKWYYKMIFNKYKRIKIIISISFYYNLCLLSCKRPTNWNVVKMLINVLVNRVPYRRVYVLILCKPRLECLCFNQLDMESDDILRKSLIGSVCITQGATQSECQQRQWVTFHRTTNRIWHNGLASTSSNKSIMLTISITVNTTTIVGVNTNRLQVLQDGKTLTIIKLSHILNTQGLSH